MILIHKEKVPERAFSVSHWPQTLTWEHPLSAQHQILYYNSIQENNEQCAPWSNYTMFESFNGYLRIYFTTVSFRFLLHSYHLKNAFKQTHGWTTLNLTSVVHADILPAGQEWDLLWPLRCDELSETIQREKGVSVPKCVREYHRHWGIQRGKRDNDYTIQNCDISKAKSHHEFPFSNSKSRHEIKLHEGANPLKMRSEGC